METFIALYDTFSHARQAATQLTGEGVERERVKLVDRDVPSLLRELDADWPDDLLPGGGPLDESEELGSGGGALLAVLAPEDAEDVLAILQRPGLIAVRQRPQELFERIVANPKEWREEQPVQVDPEVAFKRHHRANYAPKGHPYDMYVPAYHLGYELGVDRRLAGSSWDEAAGEAREIWENEQLGDWSQFAEAVAFGWRVAREGGVKVDRELENADFESTRRGRIYHELNQ